MQESPPRPHRPPRPPRPPQHWRTGLAIGGLVSAAGTFIETVRQYPLESNPHGVVVSRDQPSNPVAERNLRLDALADDERLLHRLLMGCTHIQADASNHLTWPTAAQNAPLPREPRN